MGWDLNPLISGLWSNARALPWHWIVALAHTVLAVVAGVHAMLYKRDPRAALGWVFVCLFFPLVGPLLYYMFGINRIHTQARRLARTHLFPLHVGYERGSIEVRSAAPAAAPDAAWQCFVNVSDRVTSRPLTSGNRVEMLQNGEQAYPAMLAAINAAVDRILLITYLFEMDTVGQSFIQALIAAHRRGVVVRVIIDGIGECYSWPRLSRVLRRSGVSVARFLPPRLLPPALFVNLRNHRKVLVVDGDQGFTGGMNIGARHLVASAIRRPTADIHFRVRGPVVAQLAEVFAEDWRFTTGEESTTDYAVPPHQGVSSCRCISDGPNEDLDKISLVMMGSLSAAQTDITIVTPYFLPSREIIACLQSAALRGVNVTVILPQQSNLRFIDWATRNLLGELLQREVRVFYQPPPFSHAKLFVIDGLYAQIGSANLDPRSLRLNFELNLEVTGAEAVAQLAEYVRDVRSRSTEVTLAEIDGRRLLTRIRDAACWLFMPYL